MESTVYENGYKERRSPDNDETEGEVNVSNIPRSAIMGLVKVSPFDKAFDGEFDNANRLEILQDGAGADVEFNPEYKA